MPPLPVVKGASPPGKKSKSFEPSEITDSSEDEDVDGRGALRRSKRRKLDARGRAEAAVISASPAVASDPIVQRFAGGLGGDDDDLDVSSDDEVKEPSRVAPEPTSDKRDVPAAEEKSPSSSSTTAERKTTEEGQGKRGDRRSLRSDAFDAAKEQRTQDPRRSRFGPPVQVSDNFQGQNCWPT